VVQEQLLAPGSVLTSLLTSPVAQRIFGSQVQWSHFHHEIPDVRSLLLGIKVGDEISTRTPGSLRGRDSRWLSRIYPIISCKG